MISDGTTERGAQAWRGVLVTLSLIGAMCYLASLDRTLAHSAFTAFSALAGAALMRARTNGILIPGLDGRSMPPPPGGAPPPSIPRPGRTGATMSPPDARMLVGAAAGAVVALLFVHVM